MTGSRSTRGRSPKARIAGDLYRYSDAKKDVVIERKLVDVWKGKAGAANECMNARCILRNRAKFPHKVLAVSVLKSVVYVIDSPEHAVRYIVGSRDRDLIAQHDETAKSEPGTLVLHAPNGSDKAGRERKRGTPVRGKTGRYNRPLVRGEAARLLAAVGAGTAGASKS